VFTGYVDDNDLIDLYRMCSLFAFPSWHEGFGLPILEAIRCGAAAIGSNVSSIPEVIGVEDALFDPHSPDSLASLMERALLDDSFKLSISSSSKEHCKGFSWDASGQQAIDAMNTLAKRCDRINSSSLVEMLFESIVHLPEKMPSESAIIEISNAIDVCFPQGECVEI
jgi:glycosyltransferase involved in cell wall biosynthesis